MRIGFDISQTGESKAGCGYFAHAMIQCLLEIAPQHCYSLYTSFGDFYFDPLMQRLSPYSGKNVKYGPRHPNKEAARSFWTSVSIEKNLDSPDIVHANNFWCPIQLENSRLIYTFYDLGFMVDPSWTTEPNRIGCFEGVFRSAVAADWIVAISKASRDHYLSVFPHFPRERIKIVYPCSRFLDPNAKGERPKALKKIGRIKFWLNVGTIEPRKNQYLLTEAYSRYLLEGGEPYPLVIAGGKGWKMDDFEMHIEALGLKEKVLTIGYVSDNELIWLYRNCLANLYPSHFEGFGLPVLEGMYFGAPTLASNSTSIPEIVGSSGILIEPRDVGEWVKAMLKLAQQPEFRYKLSSASIKQAAIFNWRESATQLIELYKEAIKTPKLDTSK